MSASSIGPDAGAVPSVTDRRVLDAALALAPTISRERVAQETAQQLRRAVSSDATALVLSDPELGAFEVLHQNGPDADRDHLERSLASSWHRAISDVAHLRALAGPRELGNAAWHRAHGSLCKRGRPRRRHGLERAQIRAAVVA